MLLNPNTRTRDPSMDVIRCFALFSVMAVHYFLNTGFYDRPVEGWQMFALVLVRSFFMICVPMFLVLSGYLMCGKRPGKSYFPKLLRTLGIYVLASLACAGYKVWRLGYSYGFVDILRGLAGFSLANYSWYIEMYIGLFLLIPFLNVMWANLSRGQQGLLLGILIAMTSLPSVVNIWSFGQILPDWWKDLYPVTYYLLGAWLRQEPPKIKKRWLCLGIGVVFVLAGWLNWDKSRGGTFVWGIWQGWYALPILVQTVLVFLLLTKPDYSRLGPGFARVMALLSKWSLGAYLVSYIFDQEFYPRLGAEPGGPGWGFVVVPAVYVCSLALSALLNGVYDGLSSLVKKERTAVT